MGVNESMLRSAAVTHVLDRRKKIPQIELDYMLTKETKKFWKDYSNEIKERACDIYGMELIELIEKGSVNRSGDVAKEIYKYKCDGYRAPNIYIAVQKMIKSKNPSYINFFKYLTGYITFDSIIDSIVSSNLKMYQSLKDPVSKIPGKKGITDPLREALKRGKVITLTDMSPEELGAYSIFAALVSLLLNASKSSYKDNVYILYDTIKYVQEIDLLTKREAHNYFNDMVDNMKTGDLDKWNIGLVQDGNRMFNLSSVSGEIQKKHYNTIAESKKKYPRIGIVEQFF